VLVALLIAGMYVFRDWLGWATWLAVAASIAVAFTGSFLTAIARGTHR
jgi:hypothetical protein